MRVRWIDFPEKELVEIIVNEIKHIGIEDNPTFTIYKEKYRRGIAPSTHAILKRFGSWKSFIEEYTEFDLLHDYWAHKTDEEIIEIFRLAMINSNIISINDYIKNYKEYNAPSTSILKRRFGNWNDALILAGIDVNKNIIRWIDIDKDTIVQKIYNELIRLGLTTNPRKIDYTNRFDDNNVPGPITIVKIFGGWRNVINEIKKIDNNNLIKVTNIWYYSSDEEVLSILSTEIKRISPNKMPSMVYYTNNRDLENSPSISTIINRFNSWGNVITLVNELEDKEEESNGYQMDRLLG